jgi:hypothetical protein
MAALHHLLHHILHHIFLRLHHLQMFEGCTISHGRSTNVSKRKHPGGSGMFGGGFYFIIFTSYYSSFYLHFDPFSFLNIFLGSSLILYPALSYFCCNGKESLSLAERIVFPFIDVELLYFF